MYASISGSQGISSTYMTWRHRMTSTSVITTLRRVSESFSTSVVPNFLF